MFQFQKICHNYINLPATVAVYFSFFFYNTGVVHNLSAG